MSRLNKYFNGADGDWSENCGFPTKSKKSNYEGCLLFSQCFFAKRRNRRDFATILHDEASWEVRHLHVPGRKDLRKVNRMEFLWCKLFLLYILQIIDVFSGRWLDIKFAFNGCNANVQPQRERVSIFLQILDDLIDSTFESAFCSSRSAQFHELSKFLDVSWRWRNCLGKIPIEEMRNSITFISFQMSHGQFPFRVLVRELKYAGIWIPEELRFHDSIHLMEGNKWFFSFLKNKVLMIFLSISRVQTGITRGSAFWCMRNSFRVPYQSS